MRITNVSIHNFRSLKKLENISLEEDITLLLGRNESGKTNFLNALEWFSTSVPLKEDDKCSYVDSEEEPIVSLTFKLENNEEDQFLEYFNTPLTEFQVTKYSDGKKKIFSQDQEIKFSPSIKALFNRLSNFIQEVERKSLSEIDNDLLKILRLSKQKEFEQWFGSNKKPDITADSWKELTEIIVKTLSIQTFQNSTLETNRAKLVREYKSFIDTGSKLDDFSTLLDDFLPKMVYFSEVQRLEDSISVSQYDANNSKFKTFANLARLANLDIKKLAKDHPKGRQTETKKASTKISGKINDSWTQEEVGIGLRVDGDQLLVFIEDETVSFELPSRRSEGFQYFLSFYINFMAETQHTLKNAVILLDDPGFHLHPAGQKDLLSTMEVLTENNQIIIATHSPFLIDKTKLQRIRIVQKIEKSGTSILAKFHKSDEDAFAPIRAAIGVTIGDSLFTSTYTLVVEGISDFQILNAVLSYLRNNGETKFEKDELGIFPAQGATKISYFASIFEKERYNYVIILDNDNAGRKVKNELENNEFINLERINLLSDVTDSHEGVDCEIEDLFSPSFYLERVNDSYKGFGFDLNDVTLEDLGLSDDRCSKITSKFTEMFSKKDWGVFDKTLVAKNIATHILTSRDHEFLRSELKHFIQIFRNLENFFLPENRR